jgi:hypothetical protein
LEFYIAIYLDMIKTFLNSRLCVPICSTKHCPFNTFYWPYQGKFCDCNNERIFYILMGLYSIHLACISAGQSITNGSRSRDRQQPIECVSLKKIFILLPYYTVSYRKRAGQTKWQMFPASIGSPDHVIYSHWLKSDQLIRNVNF